MKQPQRLIDFTGAVPGGATCHSERSQFGRPEKHTMTAVHPKVLLRTENGRGLRSLGGNGQKSGDGRI